MRYFEIVRPELTILSNPVELARAAAGLLTSLVANSSTNTFHLCLSGGSTPAALYALLAKDPFVSQIPWPSLRLFWGDERCVPLTDPDSNYHLVKEKLLNNLPPPDSPEVFPIQTDLPPREAAGQYEALLRSQFSSDPSTPSFEFLLLGMGDDGHTASLFPGSDPFESPQNWALDRTVANRIPNRVTLTPAILNRSRKTVILVSGRQKAAVLKEVWLGPYDPFRFPIQAISAPLGSLTWLLDEEAALELPVTLGKRRGG